MMFWIVVIAMSAATIAALALPLLGARGPNDEDRADSAEYDLEVYRDQIAELERDHARGVLSDTEVEAARAEIARRMLAADARLKEKEEAAGAERKAPGTALARGAAIATAVIVPVGAVLIYLQVGMLGAPDMPLSARMDQQAGEQPSELAHAIGELEQEAANNPANPEPWLKLGLAYKEAGRYAEAANAFRKAFKLHPATPMLNAEFGEALFMASGGTVTPEARAAFEAVLAQRPADPRAMHYLAVADYQAGKTKEALDRWAALVAASPADAPWLDPIREHMARAAEELGVDLASVMPEPLPAEQGSGPALSPEQRAKIDSMTPEERQAMIQEMVAGLEARLAENPMDLEGWERLINARVVMGDREAAQRAFDNALEAFADAPVPRQRLAALGQKLGLQGSPHAGADGVPDVNAMVARLETRLQDEPNDLEGWLMLARSYAVLGRPDDARRVMATAVKLAPDDPTVVGLEAAAVREANGGKHNAESIAILRRVLELSPNDQEALWYVGQAEANAGNIEEARRLLQRLYDHLPENSEQRPMVRQRLDALPAS